MKPNYNLREQKIYSDYSVMSDEHLLEIIQKQDNYRKEMIEIVKDILFERNKLSKSENGNRIIDQENENFFNEITDLHITQNKNKEETINILLERGYDEKVIVEKFNETEALANQKRKQAGSEDVILGSYWFFGGLAITLYTWTIAVEAGGGSYIFAYGPMIYGAVKIFNGKYKQRKK